MANFLELYNKYFRQKMNAFLTTNILRRLNGSVSEQKVSKERDNQPYLITPKASIQLMDKSLRERERERESTERKSKPAFL